MGKQVSQREPCRQCRMWASLNGGPVGRCRPVKQSKAQQEENKRLQRECGKPGEFQAYVRVLGHARADSANRERVFRELKTRRADGSLVFPPLEGE